MGRTRTNIELDDEAVETIMRRYRLRTKTEAVDMALQALAGRPMTLDEALAMEGSDPDIERPPQRPVREF
jgi:Arc/MetJ family transcription regulator